MLNRNGFRQVQLFRIASKYARVEKYKLEISEMAFMKIMKYSSSGPGEEVDTADCDSAKRSIASRSEIIENKMAADETKIGETRATVGSEILSPDEGKLAPGDHEKFGDCKNEIPDNWHIESRKNDQDDTKLSSDNTNEWKYKNLYSMSARNAEVPASWSACRTAALANGKRAEYAEVIHGTTSAILENEQERMENSGKSVLLRFREYLANYQESCGVPRTEYTFSALIKVMGQATGRALLALFYVIVNITPMAHQILLHTLRFVLDKTISIQKTNDVRQMSIKYTILGLQLLCVYVCLVFIFGSIVMPILSMAVGIFAKIML